MVFLLFNCAYCCYDLFNLIILHSPVFSLSVIVIDIRKFPDDISVQRLYHTIP